MKKLNVLMKIMLFATLTSLSVTQNLNPPAGSGCSTLKAPLASTLKCLQTVCTATCNAKYKFPKGETTLSIDCVDKKWIMKNPKYKDQKVLPGCEPFCSPPCANKGKCVAPNRCQCTKDFQGALCKEKSCPAQPVATRNSKRTCKPGLCTVTCLPGFKFKTGATSMNLQCKNGVWVSASRGLSLTTHCEAHCNPTCQNGGKCVGSNKCVCTEKFRGAQCQFSTDRCSPRKHGFNGSFGCFGSDTETICELECPEAFKFDLKPTSSFKCKLAEGKFTPAIFPKCLYDSEKVVQTNQVHSEFKPLSTVPKRVQNNAPTCSTSCQNGGTCAGNNVCQCSKNFAGTQCQFPIDRCSPKNIGFNGGFKCSGTQTGMTCSLTCPPEIDFEYPPAIAYTCEFSTGKFKPERVPKCVYGDGVQVIQRSHSEGKPQKITATKHVCSPSCLNGGVCIFMDLCQCPKMFAGPQCQYSVDRCAPKKLGFNGGIRCSGTQTGMNCVINCPPGILFDSPPATAYSCDYSKGIFSPSQVPKCVYDEGVQVIQRVAEDGEDDSTEAICTPSCQNGGTCVFTNLCQCSKNFRGDQCQFSVDRCSIKKTNFNGGFKCTGTETEMVCSLHCPDGIAYQFQPANKYTCKYETGQFTPTPIPNCVFGEGVEVIRRITSN